MPTYEYRCLDCQKSFEVVQSFTDDPLTTCHLCGGNLRKVLHPVGIQFRGSGFYSTDRRGTRPGSPRKDEGGDGTGRSEGAEGAEKAETAASGEKAGPSSEGKAGSKTRATSEAGPSSASGREPSKKGPAEKSA